MRWMNLPLSTLALIALTACADFRGDNTISATDSNPLAMTGLMVLSNDGERMLGTVESVATAPDGRPTGLTIASRPPAFPIGDRVMVAADDVLVSPSRSAAILTGLTTGEFVELLTESNMIALGTSRCPSCAPAPTNWTGARQ